MTVASYSAGRLSAIAVQTVSGMTELESFPAEE